MERIRQAVKFCTNEPSLPIDITASAIAGRKRSFIEDTDRFAQKFEKPIVLGAENIPDENLPIIIACNHPNIYDLGAGGTQITRTYIEKRKEQGLPPGIRWMIGENLVSRDTHNFINQRVVYPTLNIIIKKLHATYDFIPVPLNYLDRSKLNKQRAATLLEARKTLIDKQTAIGIFPEGDLEKNAELLNFYEGVGLLCKLARSEVLILPTAIYRDSGKLTVNFGKSINISPDENRSNITQNIKCAIKDNLIKQK